MLFKLGIPTLFSINKESRFFNLINDKKIGFAFDINNINAIVNKIKDLMVENTISINEMSMRRIDFSKVLFSREHNTGLIIDMITKL
jgi:hypothetical protein